MLTRSSGRTRYKTTADCKRVDSSSQESPLLDVLVPLSSTGIKYHGCFLVYFVAMPATDQIYDRDVCCATKTKYGHRYAPEIIAKNGDLRLLYSIKRKLTKKDHRGCCREGSRSTLYS